VLTFGCARARQVSGAAGCVGAALALAVLTSVATIAPAQAQEIMTSGCIGGWHAFNCVTLWAPAGDPFVRTVPPATAAERARAKKHERRWADRCRPVVRQDRYGVPRYHYAMPGCEFGVGEY
jgi:hypothetical protein